MPYLDLNEKDNTVSKLFVLFGKKYGIKKKQIEDALQEGFKNLQIFHAAIRAKSKEIYANATAQNKPVVVLAGRPYHVDEEINHGIHKLLTSLGVAVLTEDGVFEEAEKVKVNVLNQWTYHARLYRAAQFCVEHQNANLVQLVSFGCGLDAITTDEVRSILEKNGKLYTQIKIDEINNLGVVKIRLRSLLAAIEEQNRNKQQNS
jgi:predicted nucleotide-binding protein (sugar kinase/HSP70/actin superfamily)